MNVLYLSIVLDLVIGYGLYNDAKKRKLDNPITWFFVGLLFGVFGLLTYCYWHVWSKKSAVKSK